MALAFIPPGHAQLYDADPGWVATASPTYGSFGWSVDTGGDEDGDGFDELLVSAPFYLASGCCPSTNQEGLVRLYFGTASAPGPILSEVGQSSGTTLGMFVRSAGDIDGDGFDDVAFSSGSGFGGGTHRVHVRFGSADRLYSNAWNYDSGEYGSLGPSIDGRGDVNGDGRPDLIVGFRNLDNDRGRVLVFHGSTIGLPAFPDWDRPGPATGANFGYAVAFAGDVDADGFDDALICRAGFYDLYRGSPAGLDATAAWTLPRDSGAACHTDRPLGRAGDVNGDGYDDVAIGGMTSSSSGEIRIFLGAPGGLPPAPSQVLTGGPYFGWTVAALGDVNGDGFGDLAVGAPVFGDQSASGRAHVFLGSANGLQSTPAWTSNAIPDRPSIGMSLASAGDVNGDGRDDLVVGDHANNDLLLYYGTPASTSGPAGEIPAEGAARLQMSRVGGATVELSWGPSPCSTGLEDYIVYAGAIGDWSEGVPVVCSTDGATSWTLEADATSRFVLVAARSDDREGSLGDASSGPRPSPSAACLNRALLTCP